MNPWVPWRPTGSESWGIVVQHSLPEHSMWQGFIRFIPVVSGDISWNPASRLQKDNAGFPHGNPVEPHKYHAMWSGRELCSWMFVAQLIESMTWRVPEMKCIIMYCTTCTTTQLIIKTWTPCFAGFSIYCTRIDSKKNNKPICSRWVVGHRPGMLNHVPYLYFSIQSLMTLFTAEEFWEFEAASVSSSKSCEIFTKKGRPLFWIHPKLWVNQMVCF